MQDDKLPICLIGNIKTNRAYKVLIEIFGIEEIAKQIALGLIDQK